VAGFVIGVRSGDSQPLAIRVEVKNEPVLGVSQLLRPAYRAMKDMPLELGVVVDHMTSQCLRSMSSCR